MECVSAAVLSILSLSAWLTGVRLVINFSGCSGWWWTFGDSERWTIERNGKRDCHFIKASPFMTHTLTPVLSVSQQELLTLGQTLVHWLSGGIRTYMDKNQRSNTYKSTSMLPISLNSVSSQFWWKLTVLAPNGCACCSLLPFALTHWLVLDHRNAARFPKAWFHKWKNSICFPAASHMSAIVAHMSWSR